MVQPHAGGGDVDCSALVAGSTLSLPVAVPDAMLYVGDGHLSQGDGEVSGTAVACAVRCVLEVHLVESAPLATLHAVTPSGRLTVGLSTNLNEAMTPALDDMVTWIQTLHGGSRSGARERCCRPAGHSSGGPSVGIHAVLPSNALRRDRGPAEAVH